MIDRFLWADWDEAPAAMDFELTWAGALERCVRLRDRLAATESPGDASAWTDAVELYLLAPAIVNVALNHRICVDFGLPLHPTEYIQLSGSGSCGYDEAYVAASRALFVDAIELARAALRLDPCFPAMAERFSAAMPPGLGSFVYTSRADRYTWRGAEPAKVRALADSVLREGRPALAVGAAHGAIMPGLLLAEYLDCPLWFVRFSMFKRSDAEPVMSDPDRERIGAAAGTVLAFDEDSASGATLRLLAARIRELAPDVRSGVVIRHVSSSFMPDHVGLTWSD